jgi:hypothetical protein
MHGSESCKRIKKYPKCLTRLPRDANGFPGFAIPAPQRRVPFHPSRHQLDPGGDEHRLRPVTQGRLPTFRPIRSIRPRRRKQAQETTWTSITLPAVLMRGT